MNVILIVLLSWTPAFTASTADSQRKGRTSEDGGRVERMLRERAPQERTKLQQRFQKLRKLSPEKRRELLDRARSLHEVEKRVHRRAPETLRRELREDPEKAPRKWRRHVEKELKDRGRRHVEKLPPEIRRLLREASPGERVRLLRRFQSRRMDLGRLGRALELDAAEVERLEALADKERRRAFFRLRRQLVEQIARLNGIPGGFGEDEWRRMELLGDVEFFRRLRERGISARDFHPRATGGGGSHALRHGAGERAGK